jgi:hypothetical protein
LQAVRIADNLSAEECLMKLLVLTVAAVALFGWVAPVQAAPITSDTIQILGPTGLTVATSSLSEGPGSPCTFSSLSFQCETTSISVPFTYAPGTYPADVAILLTNPDGSVSDFVTVDLTTFDPVHTGIGMSIYSDVDGSPFPSVAQFLAGTNLPTTSLAETGDLQNLTSLALGLVPTHGFGDFTVSPAPQVSGFTFEAQSDLAAEPVPVPEPASLVLLGTGLLATVSRFRRRRSTPNVPQ